MQVSTPARRAADAQGTASIPAKRAGVRCGPPAPLRVATGRAQPEPKHRFGRWRRPATGCGAGVSNNQRCRTKKFRSACRRTGQGRCRRTGQGRCRRTGQGRCRRTGQGRCRRTAPYARSASRKPMSTSNCSMEAAASTTRSKAIQAHADSSGETTQISAIDHVWRHQVDQVVEGTDPYTFFHKHLL